MREWVKKLEPTSRGMLVVVVLAVLIVWHGVPVGRQVLYPFTLLATWVHEMGHGLTALAAGGSFDRLEIFANASGLAWTSSSAGAAAAAVAFGGLLAPPVVGAAMLLSARTPARAQVVLGALALLLAGSLIFWVRTLVGLVAVLLLAALIGVVAWFGGRLAVFTMQLVGVLLALDTVTRIDYVFTGSVVVDGQRRPSDIAHVATHLGGHYLLWGVLVAVLSLVICLGGLWLAWRPAPPAVPGQAPPGQPRPGQAPPERP